MKNQIIVGVILLVIGGIFAKNKLFDDKVELKYSLSERISANFESDSMDIGIQQLIIKNSGDVLIKPIHIKINGKIQDYQIIKFKYTDSISAKKTNSKLEILYPELVPDANIVILLKSNGKSINNNDVEIFHSKGEAEEAFSSDDSYINIVFIGLVLIYLYFIISNFLKASTSLFDHELNYNQIEFLRKKKKWFLKESQWMDLRKKAIINYASKRELLSSIENQNCFKVLNSNEKDFLSEEEVFLLYEEAEKQLEQLIIEKIYNGYYTDSLYDEFVILQKPLKISNEKWIKLKDTVSIAYCIHNTRQLLKNYSEYSIRIFLSSGKPEFINETDWHEMLEITESAFLFLTLKSQLSNLRLGGKLEFRENNFLSTKSQDIQKEILERLNNGLNKEDYFNNLVEIYRDVLTWEELPDKPKLISEKDWNSVKYIFEKVVSIKRDLEKDRIDVAKNKDEYSSLVRKVRLQLKIIDDLLIDPNSINKIEEYDIPFAKGNWSNLLKLGEVMVKK